MRLLRRSIVDIATNVEISIVCLFIKNIRNLYDLRISGDLDHIIEYPDDFLGIFRAQEVLILAFTIFRIGIDD